MSKVGFRNGGAAEVSIVRYRNVRECYVVVSFRNREIAIKCDDYNAATKWARIEHKSYGVTTGVKVISD